MNTHRLAKRIAARNALANPLAYETLHKAQQANMLWRAIETRHKQRGLECSLTFEDVLEMVEETDVCPLTGVPFSNAKNAQDPWRRSADRRDNHDGYHPHNVRIISKWANTALWTWGGAVFERGCLGVAKRLGWQPPVENEYDENQLNLDL